MAMASRLVFATAQEEKAKESPKKGRASGSCRVDLVFATAPEEKTKESPKRGRASGSFWVDLVCTTAPEEKTKESHKKGRASGRVGFRIPRKRAKGHTTRRRGLAMLDGVADAEERRLCNWDKGTKQSLSPIS